MWNTRENNINAMGDGGVVAVAVCKEISSQYAFKWALDNLFPRGNNAIKLVHVIQRPNPDVAEQERDPQALEVLLPYRIYCIRRQVQFETAVVYDTDVARALSNYVSINGVETLVVGSSSRNGIFRIFKSSDIANNVLKWAPDFCNIYIISKGKVSARLASRSPPTINSEPDPPPPLYDEVSLSLSAVENEYEFSSVGSASRRLSTDSNFVSFYENLECGLTSTLEPLFSNPLSCNNIEDQVRILKSELQQTTDMCREALESKHKLLNELEEWKMEQERRMKEIESAAVESIEKEKERCKEAIEEAQRHAEKVLSALGVSHFHSLLKYQTLFHILLPLLFFFLYHAYKNSELLLKCYLDTDTS